MKNVLITGGTRGLGKAVALEFGKAGYAVYALYRADQTCATNAQVEFRSEGIDARIIQQDVTLPFAGPLLSRAVEESVGQWNLIHCAAPPFEPRPLRMNSWESIIEQFATSIWGVELCTRLLLPKFRIQGGSIVSILSDVIRKPQTGFATLCASKTALSGWSACAAQELAALAVKVFTVSPRTDAALEREVVARHIRRRIEDASVPGMGEDYPIL